MEITFDINFSKRTVISFFHLFILDKRFGFEVLNFYHKGNARPLIWWQYSTEKYNPGFYFSFLFCFGFWSKTRKIVVF